MTGPKRVKISTFSDAEFAMPDKRYDTRRGLLVDSPHKRHGSHMMTA